MFKMMNCFHALHKKCGQESYWGFGYVNPNAYLIYTSYLINMA